MATDEELLSQSRAAAEGPDFENFAFRRHGNIAVITFNRVEKHNSLTRAFWNELQEALHLAESDGETRVVVVTGAGEHAFSAGGDIAGFAALDTIGEKERFQVEAMAAFAAVESSPLPVIAAVNGFALGGGCELAIACDVVLASDNARFGMPEARIGLVPGYGVTRSASSLGLHWSKWLVFTGEIIEASTAERIGLVQRVVPRDRLLDQAMETARAIASQAPLAISAGKALINASATRTETSASVAALTGLHDTEDAQEGIRAFNEKRAPRFDGR